jgi:hypothetical protein
MSGTQARIRELTRTPKAQLARIHAANGGLMGVAVYSTWSKDELVNAVLEDEGINPWDQS